MPRENKVGSPRDTSPSMRAVGCSVPVARSVGARPQKPAQIHADAERVAIKLQRNAATEIKLEIYVADRFVVNAGVVSVVAREVRRARRDAAGRVPATISAAATSAALGCETTAEDPADHRLISPRCDVIERSRETELAWIVFDAAVKLRVIAVCRKGPTKVS